MMPQARPKTVRSRLVTGTVLGSGMVLMLAVPNGAQAQVALPDNGTVIAGNVGWSIGSGVAPTNGGVINPTPAANTGQLNLQLNTNSSVINWNGFSIGSSGGTPDVISFTTTQGGPVAVLNRVTGAGVSRLDGTLTAPNIAVWLINPNGIMVGPNAVLSAGQFVGSTLDLKCTSIDCSLAGDAAAVAQFGAANGTIALAARSDATALNGITVAAGAQITGNTGGIGLLGGKLTSNGSLTSSNGTIALVAARDVTMSRPNSSIQFTITRGTPVAGDIVTTGGSISGSTVTVAAAALNDAMLNLGGSITATKVTLTNGIVVLGGADSSGLVISNTATDAGGRVTVNGLAGATLTAQNSGPPITGSGLLIEGNRDILIDRTAALTAGAGITMRAANAGISLDGGSGATIGALNAVGAIDINGRAVTAATRSIGAVGNITVTGTAGDVTLGSLDSHGAISVSGTAGALGSGNVTIGSAAADSTIDVKASALAKVTGTVTAGRTVNSFYHVTGDTVELGGVAPVAQQASGEVAIVGANGIVGNAGLSLAANNDRTGGEALSLTSATGAITLDRSVALTAGYADGLPSDVASDIVLRALGNRILLDGGSGAIGQIKAGRTVDVKARDVQASSRNATGVGGAVGVVANAGDVLLGSANAGSTITLDASDTVGQPGGSVVFGTGTATGDIDVRATNVAAISGNITAGGHYSVRGDYGVTLGNGTDTVVQKAADYVSVVTQKSGAGTVYGVARDGTITGRANLTLQSNSAGPVAAGDARGLTLDSFGAIAFDMPVLAGVTDPVAARLAIDATTPKVDANGALLKVRAGSGKTISLGTVTARAITSLGPQVGANPYSTLVSGYGSVLTHNGTVQFNTVTTTEALAIALYDPADATRAIDLRLNGASSATGDVALAASGTIGGYVLRPAGAGLPVLSLAPDLTASALAGASVRTLSRDAALGNVTASKAIDLRTNGGDLSLLSAQTTGNVIGAGIGITAQGNLRLASATAAYGDVALMSATGDITGRPIPDTGAAITDYGRAVLTAQRGSIMVGALSPTPGFGLVKLGTSTARDSFIVDGRRIDAIGQTLTATQSNLRLTGTALATGPSGVDVGTARAGTAVLVQTLGPQGSVTAALVEAGLNHAVPSAPGSTTSLRGTATVTSAAGDIRVGTVRSETGDVIVTATVGSVTGLASGPATFGHATMNAAVATPAAGADLAIGDGDVKVTTGPTGAAQLLDLTAGRHVEVTGGVRAEVIGDVSAGLGLASGHYTVSAGTVVLGNDGDDPLAGAAEDDVQQAYDNILITSATGPISGGRRLKLTANSSGRADVANAYGLALDSAGAIRLGAPTIPTTIDALLPGGGQAQIDAETARVAGELDRLAPTLSTGGSQSLVLLRAQAGAPIAVGTVTALGLGTYGGPTDRIAMTGAFAANRINTANSIILSASQIELNRADTRGLINLQTAGFLRGYQLSGAVPNVHASYALATDLFARNAIMVQAGNALIGTAQSTLGSVGLTTTAGALVANQVLANTGIELRAQTDLRLRLANTATGDVLAYSTDGDISGLNSRNDANLATGIESFDSALLTARDGSIEVDALSANPIKGNVKLGTVTATSSEVPALALPTRGNVTIEGRAVTVGTIDAQFGKLRIDARQLAPANYVGLTLGTALIGTTADITVGGATGAALLPGAGSADIAVLNAGLNARSGGPVGTNAIAGTVTITTATDARLGTVTSRTGAVKVTATDGDVTGRLAGGTFGSANLASAQATAAAGGDRQILNGDITVLAGQGGGSGTTAAGKGLAKLGLVTAGGNLNVDAQAILATDKQWARNGTARLRALHGDLTAGDVEAGTGVAALPGQDVILFARVNGALATPALGTGSITAVNLFADRNVAVDAQAVATISGNVLAGRVSAGGAYTVDAGSALLGVDADSETQTATGLVRITTAGDTTLGQGLTLVANSDLAGGEGLTITKTASVTPGNVTIDRTAILLAGFTSGTQFDSASNILINSPRGTIGFDGGAGTVGAVSAGGSVRVGGLSGQPAEALAVSAASRTFLAQAGSVAVGANGGNVSLFQGLAGIDVLIDARAGVLGLGDVDLVTATAGRNVAIGSVQRVSGTARVTGDILAGKTNPLGSYSIVAAAAELGNDADTELQRAAGSVSVDTTGNITGGAGLTLSANYDGTGGEDLTLSTSAGNIAVDVTAALFAGFTAIPDSASDIIVNATAGAVNFDGGSGPAGAVSAGGSVKVGGTQIGGLLAEAVAASSRTFVAKTGSVLVGAKAGNVSLGSGNAGVDVLLDAVAGARGAGNVDLGTATAVRNVGIGTVQRISGTATVTGNVSAGDTNLNGDYTINATGAAILGQNDIAAYQRATGAVTINAAGSITGGKGLTLQSNRAGTGVAATTALALTSTNGDIRFDAYSQIVGGTGTAGSPVTIKASNGVAVLGRVSAVNTALSITAQDLQLQATPADGASPLTFLLAPAGRAVTIDAGSVNIINSATVGATKLGMGTDEVAVANAGVSLTENELKRIRTPKLTIRSDTAGTGVDPRDVQIGMLTLDPITGSSLFAVYGTGKIDVTGAFIGTGSGRTVQLGGNALDASRAASINVKYDALTPGSINVGDSTLDLRGTRIIAGRTNFVAAAPTMTDAAVDLVSNSSSQLYNAGALNRADAFAAPVNLVTAGRLIVRYGEYALFQNTAPSSGTFSGIRLTGAAGTAGPPSTQALQLMSASTAAPNSFAAFGTIVAGDGGTGGPQTALLGSSFIGLTGANPNNSRLNGCLIGVASGGCLATPPPGITFTLGDVTRDVIFGADDNALLSLDPVVGSNNEALLGSYDNQTCPDGADSAQCKKEK